MSTPALINFVANGETKSAYKHWDGDMIGRDLLSWLRIAKDGDLVTSIASLTVVRDFPNERGPATPKPTAYQRRKLAAYENKKVSGDGEHWYRQLRQCQGDPALILASGYIVDTDLDAGWVYTIDADKRMFLVEVDSSGPFGWSWDALPSDDEWCRQMGIPRS